MDAAQKNHPQKHKVTREWEMVPQLPPTLEFLRPGLLEGKQQEVDKEVLQLCGISDGMCRKEGVHREMHPGPQQEALAGKEVFNGLGI